LVCELTSFGVPGGAEFGAGSPGGLPAANAADGAANVKKSSASAANIRALRTDASGDDMLLRIFLKPPARPSGRPPSREQASRP
jgi:hypothetical protein